MPFLSTEEVASRVSSPDNLVNRLALIPKSSPGNRGAGIPIEIQKVIADIASDPEREETQAEIAEAFGISQERVSQLARGVSLGSRTGFNPEVKEVVDRNKGKRQEAETQAIDNLLQVLHLIPEKLQGPIKLKKLTSVAKDMAIVADKMGKRDDSSGAGSQVNLNIYVPKMNTLDKYEIIDV